MGELVGAHRAIVPTTTAQVSGHKFLRRRVEHGLVLGDIRMIHDPLSTRHRAFIFGVIAALLVGLGAGLLAWLKPNPDPGDAVIVRDSQHGLYVQLDGTLHPVTNLTSARLIAGEAAEPAMIGNGNLQSSPRGVPVGIHSAPGIMADDAPEHWMVCTDPDTGAISVVASRIQPQHVPAPQAALVQDQGTEWYLDGAGRRALPAADTPEGRVLRRQLGLHTQSSPVSLDPSVLSVLPEHPAWTVPGGERELLLVEGQQWWSDGTTVAPVTDLQVDILRDLGATPREVSRAKLAEFPDSAVPLALPAERPEWVEVAGVCVDKQGLVVRPEVTGAVELSGEGVADYFSNETQGAVGVDTGAGRFVIGDTGLRFAVDEQGWAALGLEEAVDVPWSILSLLPEGPDLSREAAVSAVY